MKLISIPILACLLLAVVGITRSQDEETRRHQLHDLGGPYFVSRDKVQEEMKLSDEQKQRLQEKLTTDLLESKDLLGKLKKLKGGEREKLMQPSYERLEAFLKGNLTADQFKRFQQLLLQYDTPSIMLRPEIVTRLNIAQEQRQQFMGAIQGMQAKIAPLMQEAKSGGNQQEILLEVTKLRQDCQGQIMARLNDAQRQQWAEMTGKPFVIW
jgi:Skp family chaperone for outer membrane proteins